jgi:hypothetical protein
MERLSWRRRTDQAAALLLMVCCAVFFAWRARHGMRYRGFGDETMHFLGAQVIQKGGLLYRDFIDLHGPLTYAIPQLYGVLFGWAAPTHARAIMVALTLTAAGAIIASRCLSARWERIVAGAVFLGLITPFWLVQSLCLYNYQPVCGALFMVAMACFVIPAWFGERVPPSAAFLAGFCLAATPFLTFSYGPAAVLLFVSGVWASWATHEPVPFRALLAGVAVLVCGMAGWLLVYADPLGYLVFHFIHGIVDFGPYLNYGMGFAVLGLWMPVAPGTLAQDAASVCAGVGLLALAWSGAARRATALPFAIGVAGIILTNPRGSETLQDGTFLFVAFGTAALGLARLPRGLGWQIPEAARAGYVLLLGLVVAGVELVARHATSSPQGFTRAEMHTLLPESLAPGEEPWAVQIRRVTSPDERILAVPYNPDVYAIAGRLPINGYLYYLPWDADYARHPWFGLQHDLCADIRRNPPPVIYDNQWRVWGRWDPKQYMACLTPILAAQYRLMPGETDFYVRLDRVNRLAP